MAFHVIELDCVLIVLEEMEVLKFTGLVERVPHVDYFAHHFLVLGCSWRLLYSVPILFMNGFLLGRAFLRFYSLFELGMIGTMHRLFGPRTSGYSGVSCLLVVGNVVVAIFRLL